MSLDSIGPADGIVLHSPILYDITLWLATAGKESAFRRQLLALARVKSGERVLDVGCGTGTLAIAAKHAVGETGLVIGVDASPEMLERAKRKSEKAQVLISFQQALAQSLPVPDSQFDLVFSVAMLHHLPEKARRQCLMEIRRVLKPGGRLLTVDFPEFNDEKRTLLSHFHRPHGQVTANDIAVLLAEAGLSSRESGEVGVRDLWYILAARVE